MFQRTRLSSSEGFRHICRPLRAGERIPPLPGLAQQIESYQYDRMRLAALEEAEPADAEPEVEDFEFDEED
ncbi:MAG: hypothetical protein OHK0026_11680 [Rhodocyclaceae bacterium]